MKMFLIMCLRNVIFVLNLFMRMLLEDVAKHLPKESKVTEVQDGEEDMPTLRFDVLLDDGDEISVLTDDIYDEYIRLKLQELSDKNMIEPDNYMSKSKIPYFVSFVNSLGEEVDDVC